jgi:hypothetical protein
LADDLRDNRGNAASATMTHPADSPPRRQAGPVMVETATDTGIFTVDAATGTTVLTADAATGGAPPSSGVEMATQSEPPPPEAKPPPGVDMATQACPPPPKKAAPKLPAPPPAPPPKKAAVEIAIQTVAWKAPPPAMPSSASASPSAAPTPSDEDGKPRRSKSKTKVPVPKATLPLPGGRAKSAQCVLHDVEVAGRQFSLRCWFWWLRMCCSFLTCVGRVLHLVSVVVFALCVCHCSMQYFVVCSTVSRRAMSSFTRAMSVPLCDAPSAAMLHASGMLCIMYRECFGYGLCGSDALETPTVFHISAARRSGQVGPPRQAWTRRRISWT